MKDDAARAGLRRPHYSNGDRLRIIRQGAHFGEECVIEGAPTPVTITDGYVLTYLYYVRLDDGTLLDLAEELLAPLSDSSLS